MVGSRITTRASAVNARWHARLAALLAASKKYERAVAHFRRALSGLEEATAANENPEDETQWLEWRVRWQFELAAIECKRGYHSRAVELYETIMQTNPGCVEAQVNLAAQLAITDANRLEEALGLCMQALALNPNLAEAHYNRNVLLRRMGRQSEAVRVYWNYLIQEIGADVVKKVLPAKAELLYGDGELRADTFGVDNGGHLMYNSVCENNGFVVLCVKWGTKYGAEYVNKLYNSVMRHCGGLRLNLVCLTDNIDGIDQHDNLITMQLYSGWKGWWNKCQLFSDTIMSKLRALGHSRCLYLDLDIVIVGNLADLLSWSPPPGVLGLLKTDHMVNEQRCGGYNSSIMAWRIDNDEHDAPLLVLHDFLHAHYIAISKYIYKFDHWLEMASAGTCFLQNTFPDQIVEYCSLDKKAPIPPPNATIVCFPLVPKPHEATAPWIAKHWV
ncbi:Tetratricopeptide TPR2 [Plasmopara halstedii]|uniref:Tetratricopeptide TPR2 n=1 Tax=Plasmopara halstedii TaxID=4781 RepID=A0A0P1AT03_PLAHL|nr:Tetratricopeptide TPR2 [Plasmopara halstedii]CEG44917.1 Tetratricopeptide TPR2 [Plasmopara halstedii]|eukprot:XP_024581286.1 Tetratricopeptide TPR2 [Plasmopara halstedii]